VLLQPVGLPLPAAAVMCALILTCTCWRTQEAILYSFDLSTVPSILPAFANKRDLIICDEVGGAALRFLPVFQPRWGPSPCQHSRRCVRLEANGIELNVESIIPAQAACFPVQNGALLSRAKVLYFKHNDVVDLERVLQSVAAEDARKKCASGTRSLCMRLLNSLPRCTLPEWSACCAYVAAEDARKQRAVALTLAAATSTLHCTAAL